MLGLRQLGLDAADAGVRGGGARWPAAGFPSSVALARPGVGWMGRSVCDSGSAKTLPLTRGSFLRVESPGKSRGQLEVSRPPGQWGADVAVALSSRGT